MQSNLTSHQRFRLQDVAQIAVGACVMAFPVAVTEEVWNLGKELSLTRVLLFALASLIFLGILIYVLHGHHEFPASRNEFLKRVASTYFVTLIISALLLFGVDRIDLVHEPMTALNRTILVAFPASFAATVVDSLGSPASGG